MSLKFFLNVVPIFIYLMKPGSVASVRVIPPPPGAPKPAPTDKGSPIPPPEPEPEPEPELPISTAVCNTIGFTHFNPANSCREIFEAIGQEAGRRNAFYYIQTGDGPQEMYCNMEDEHCGMRGWLLVGDVDASAGACPENFRLDEAPGGVKVCRGETRRAVSGPGPRYEMTFPVNGLSFTKVTGFVEAYQFGTPDAFSTQDAAKMDGIIFYYGNSRTRHLLWAYAAGKGDFDCPCSTTPGDPAPSGFGRYYYCDSGNPDPSDYHYEWFMDKVLWSGNGCPDTNTCCDPPNLPYFCQSNQQHSSTTDKFIVEVNFNEDRDDEDIGITRLGFYVA
jgi:hypothetical protein